MILLISAAMLAMRVRQPQTLPAPEMRLQITTPAEGSNSAFALSPDRRKLAFLAQGKYWLRPLDSETAEPLPGTEKGGNLFGSPDSRSFGFSSGDHLKRFDMDLNVSRTIAGVSGTGMKGGSCNNAGILLLGPPVTGCLCTLSPPTEAMP